MDAAEEALHLLESPTLGNTVLRTLFLHANLKWPIEIDPSEFPEPERIAGMAYYYYGLNRLRLRVFEKTRAELFHALTCKSCGDFRGEIQQAFVLSCFLTHLSLSQVQELVRSPGDIGEEGRALWDFETELHDLPMLYVELLADIAVERKKQHLVKLSQIFSRILVENVMSRVGFYSLTELQSMLESLEQGQLLKYQINGNIITFSIPNVSEQIQRKAEEFRALKRATET
jgi:hypothetical protein